MGRDRKHRAHLAPQREHFVNLCEVALTSSSVTGLRLFVYTTMLLLFMSVFLTSRCYFVTVQQNWRDTMLIYVLYMWRQSRIRIRHKSYFQ